VSHGLVSSEYECTERVEDDTEDAHGQLDTQVGVSGCRMIKPPSVTDCTYKLQRDFYMLYSLSDTKSSETLCDMVHRGRKIPFLSHDRYINDSKVFCPLITDATGHLTRIHHKGSSSVSRRNV
jgi:hypothetical protein